VIIPTSKPIRRNSATNFSGTVFDVVAHREEPRTTTVPSAEHHRLCIGLQSVCDPPKFGGQRQTDVVRQHPSAYPHRDAIHVGAHPMPGQRLEAGHRRQPTEGVTGGVAIA